MAILMTIMKKQFFFYTENFFSSYLNIYKYHQWWWSRITGVFLFFWCVWGIISGKFNEKKSVFHMISTDFFGSTELLNVCRRLPKKFRNHNKRERGKNILLTRIIQFQCWWMLLFNDNIDTITTIGYIMIIKIWFWLK